MKLKLLFITIALFVVCGSWGQIYQHDFGSTAITTHPYIVAASTLNANLSNSSWSNSTLVWTSFGGSSGQAIALNNSSGTPIITLTFNVDSGYQLTVDSFDFWRQRSNTGSQNWSMTINGVSVGGGTIPTTGSALGVTTVSNAISNLTGTITVVISLSGASGTGTFRLDDFTLNGSVTSIGPTSTKSGDWNDSTVWSTGIVPTATDNVTISATHTVYTSTALTRTGTTTVNGIFQLNAGGWATGTNFTYGATGGLYFNNTSSYGVSNGDVFWPTTNGPFNVNVLQGGVTLNSANRTVAGTFQTSTGVTLNTSTLALNGTTQINAGGFFNQSPIYGTSSTLIYNTGGTYGRGYEWTESTGTIGTTPGYPNNIQLSNSTTLNYNNGTPLAKAIAGNLTIDSGSSFFMDYGGGASGGALTVAGNVTNNGNLTLGNTSGDDLKLGGNFTNTGIFNGNNRAVFFTKVGTQTITSLSGITIPYVVLSGGTTVQLATGTNLIISAPLTGNAVSFTNATDVFDINSNTLTIGTSGIANVINGAGTFKGSTTSNLTLLGTGSIGTLNFTPSFQNLGILTMDRQAATIGCVIGSAVTINTALNLTNGLIDLGANTMTLTSACSNTFGDSVNSYVISDETAAGNLRKNVIAIGSYHFPIGDRTASANGSQYSPATITFTAATISGWLALSVEDSKEPNNDAPTDFITRYWNLTSSGITNATYDFAGTYLPTDISGTETNCKSGRYSTSNSSWTNGANLVGGTNVISLTGLTSASGALSSPNHFTAGYRNQEINIKGLTNSNIVSGSATASGLNNTLFSLTNIGSSSTKDFEIQNLGVATLNLSGTPIVSIGGANPGDFTVTTFPSSSAIVGGASTTFVITFSPTLGGIRTAIVSITNNDSDENPYTFLIQGTGNCPTTTNTITPISGPAGTEVTINATANNLTGATVTFNGIAATSITYVSSTQIKVIVPTGAISGNLVTTNATGCQATNTFTVINNLNTSCQGGNGSSDLFISEVTDATAGGLTYIEIYNGTGNTINLSNYALQTFSNGNSTTSSVINLNNVNLASGSIYVVALGISLSPSTTDTCTLITGGNGELANQASTNGGVNFDTNGNDYIALYNISSNTTIDSFGTYLSNSWASSLGLGDRGAVFRRLNTAILPSVNYSNSDWTITNWAGSGSGSCSTNDYSDIGVYNFISGTPPTITQQPVYSPSCKATSLTVSGTEGYSGGNPLAYQWYGVAPNVTTWTALTNAGIYSGATTATLNIANLAGLDGYQYYCQIRENGISCYTASNAIEIVEAQTLTWNGSSWSPNSPSPSLSTIVVIDGNYNTSTNGNLNACSVIVNTGKTLEVTADNYVNIQNDLTVNGTLKVLDKGSLVMIDDAGIVTNNGITDIHRFTTLFEKFDYTYWSTPIVSTNIVTTFPTWRTDNAYEFLPANFNDVAPVDGFDDNGDDWVNASTMTPGKGYIIMGATDKSMYPTVDEVVFSGKVNNGVITPSIFLTPNADSEDDFNLIGNPYPSAVDADLFINTNLPKISGTLYFWTHKDDLGGGLNLGPDASNYSQDDYAMYNLSGGTATSATTGTASVSNSSVPLGYIASCQGFFVEAEVDNTPITFNNAMRVGLPDTANSQFYKIRQGKSKIVSKDRLWLNMENSVGMFSQQLVGYFENATLGYDKGYDGLVSDGGNYVNFYSFIENETYKIQGRSAFDENDQVRLGYFSAVAGTFNINIDSKEGVFNNSNTPVYLEDKLLNVIYDLKTAPYTFATESGTFNDRFILRYNNKTLGTADFETLENQVLISNKNKQIKVYSAVESIDKVAVYDLLGRQIYKKEKVNSNEVTILNLVSSQQTLLVKVILQNRQTVTKKIVN
ncbi:MAG: T9SS sorting signal type C domain-containing protein [Flavobacterium sp.]|uniref:T9SS sorting signal type C domain-containing protein n=1 Tax=Flavobacterium sp. TaxID=239 RepID=UPI002632FED7|nr:T9SS sorting signal type C domain-containing protein [Flavobacterium sp.]MDD5150323.1 T9SS sorting signal type C domain-containing protein [Flavobacterium sp.]